VVPIEYQVVVRSEGTVQPRTSSTLIPQVSGIVRSISPSFREGGFFEKGQVLVTLDSRDYELAMASSEAQVAQAESALQQELAQAEVVKNDWKLLGKEAPKLGLRQPQINAARAALASARAQLERARTDLDRTRIRAPYPGQMLEKNVDVGQFVSPGTVLAQIYATDYVEIRLPLSTSQLEFVDLPDRFRGDQATVESGGPWPSVTILGDIGRKTWRWEGKIVRAEGAIDTRSRQLFVVAQVNDPYGRKSDGRPPLRIGQFVRAEIQGSRIPDAIVLPRSALREGSEVLVVDGDSRLQRRQVDVAWADDDQTVIIDGLQAGEIVSVTPLAAAASGARVQAIVDGVPPERSPDESRAGAATGAHNKSAGSQ
jgi:RND family efflux transporter MFP subunit